MFERFSICIVALAAMTMGSPAYADLIFSIDESAPGSATVEEGIGGTISLGFFAQRDVAGDINLDAFDSYDLYIDIGDDGNGLPASGITFAATPVVAGTVFSNSAKNPSSDSTVGLANADIQVSADRSLFAFSTNRTKLFDLVLDLDSTVPAGNYGVSFRDDSGFDLLAVNNDGSNLLVTNPGQVTFGTGTFSVSAVPEPSSLALLAFAPLWMLRRRRTS